jgi:integrase
MFFQRKRGREVCIYYWDKGKNGKRGKQVPVPREETKHLDELDDRAIEQWMKEWAAAHNIQRSRASRRSRRSDDKLTMLFKAHIAEHRALRQTRDSTISEYQQHFDTYISPYFVTHHGVKDPTKWYPHTAQFPMFLLTQEKPTTNANIKKICDTLVRFGKYLAQHQIIPTPYLVPSIKIGRRKPPLSKKAAPKDILGYAKNLPSEWALFLLISYFGGLRPEEVFALSKEDFITGTAAKLQSKTYHRFQKFNIGDVALGSGLSVHIDKTITRREVLPLTKNHYAKGVVNFWHVEAARVIAGLLAAYGNGRLFPGARHILNARYFKLVKPVTGLNAQDLRRASSNYLGKEVGLDPILLQDHLRHAELSTTMLYVRDPSEREESDRKQNFDDVG